MKNASRTEGQVQGESGEAEPHFFPSEGNFSPVVPLTQAGEEAAHTGDLPSSVEPEEEETTLVPPRVSPRPAHTPRARQGVEQSWASLVFAVSLSLLAGAATGVYMFSWQHPAEADRAGPPAVESMTAEKVAETEAAAEPPIPQSSEPAPQTDRDSIADAPAASVKTAEPAVVEKVAKAGRVNTSVSLKKAPQPEAEPSARRAAEPAPRVERPARAVAEARKAAPAPRLTRTAGEPRQPDSYIPTPVTPSARPPLVSSPPPSAKPKKVIQWP